MPDCGDSTAPRVPVPESQHELLRVADELQRPLCQLRRIANAVVAESGSALAASIRGVAECVCSDLLQDAIETLRAAGQLTEERALQEQARLAELTTILAVGE